MLKCCGCQTNFILSLGGSFLFSKNFLSTPSLTGGLVMPIRRTTKGYLSFPRQISAINAPKANTKLLSVKPIGVFLILQRYHRIARHTHVHINGSPIGILRIQSLQGPLPFVCLALRFVYHTGSHLYDIL